MMTRLLAVLPANTVSHVKHYRGLPPEVSGDEDSRSELAPAAFLLIEESKDGVFLNRFDVKSNCVGDTWRLSVDDAKHQASFEYTVDKDAWIAIYAFDANDNRTEFLYDANQQLTQVNEPDDGGGGFHARATYTSKRGRIRGQHAEKLGCQ
jgi:hypothetical protein